MYKSLINSKIITKEAAPNFQKFLKVCYFWEIFVIKRAINRKIILGNHAPRPGERDRLFEKVAANFETMTKAAPRMIPMAR